MKTTKLSDKIEDGGCVIEANENKDLLDIDSNEVIKIFENKGIILFKNFNIDKDQIVQFTDQFTQQYANDANRREIRFENPNLHNVIPYVKKLCQRVHVPYYLHVMIFEIKMLV